MSQETTNLQKDFLIDLPNTPLSWEEVSKLLLQPSQKISNVPAVRPLPGCGYFFQGQSFRSRNDYCCDQYRFIYDGSYKNRYFGICKRYYKIKLRNGKGRETSPAFQRHVYNLLAGARMKEAPICLVHYLGDSTFCKHAPHGNSKKNTGIYLPTLKTVFNDVSKDCKLKTPANIYKDYQSKMSHESDQRRMPVDRPRNVKQCKNVQ